MVIPPAVRKVNTENWKPVREYWEYYEVSDSGDVRRRGGSVTLKPTISSNGDRKVMLFADGVLRHKLISDIVLEAFVGPRPRGCECWHLNDDPGDNRLSNLAWSPPRAEHTRSVSPETPNQRKRFRCTDAEVAEVERLLGQGMTGAEISKRCGVSEPTVSRIKTGRRQRRIQLTKLPKRCTESR